MRAPRPAANTMAALGICGDAMSCARFKKSGFGARVLAAERARQMGLIPELDRLQQGMRKTLAEIAFYARQVREVSRLAVALIEPRENAEDLGRPLRAHRRIGGG